MKKIFFLFILFLGILASAQSKVYLKKPYQVGEVNTLIYEPEKSVPEQTNSYLIYEELKKKMIPLTKVGSHYEINFKLPESANAFIVGFKDNTDFIDNNKNKGFIFYLKEVNESKINVMKMMGLSQQLLKTDYDLAFNIKEFERIFQEEPSLKNNDNTLYYLSVKYQNGDADADELINKKIVELQNGNETDYYESTKYYGLMQNWEERGNVIKKGAEKFPKSEMAKEVFFKDNYQKIDEKNYNEVLSNFKDTFGEIDDNSKNYFASIILSKLMFNPNSDKKLVLEFGKFFLDEIMFASFLNNGAWYFSGEEIANDARDLENGKVFSQKSIDIIKNRLANPKDEDDLGYLQGQYNTYTDTFALLLYKDKKYKEAFDLQQAILEKKGLDTGGKERYSAYAESAMGLDFAKKYIIDELDNGLNSKVLYQQLRSIYKKQNFTSVEIDKLTQKYKLPEQVKAPSFALKNLDGNVVNMEELRGKVVILDFWATWCGPCIESFPKMQKLVSKYNKNSEVVFLFINTLEGKVNENRRKKVQKFINKKKYTFNVLLDEVSKTANLFNVQAIPTKVVIDKNGNIVFNGFGEIEKHIERSLKN